MTVTGITTVGLLPREARIPFWVSMGGMCGLLFMHWAMNTIWQVTPPWKGVVNEDWSGVQTSTFIANTTSLIKHCLDLLCEAIA